MAVQKLTLLKGIFINKEKNRYLPKISQKFSNLSWKLVPCIQLGTYSIPAAKTYLGVPPLRNFEASLSTLSYSLSIYDLHR